MFSSEYYFKDSSLIILLCYQLLFFFFNLIQLNSIFKNKQKNPSPDPWSFLNIGSLSFATLSTKTAYLGCYSCDVSLLIKVIVPLQMQVSFWLNVLVGLIALGCI